MYVVPITVNNTTILPSVDGIFIRTSTLGHIRWLILTLTVFTLLIALSVVFHDKVSTVRGES